MLDVSEWFEIVVDRSTDQKHCDGCIDSEVIANRKRSLHNGPKIK